MYEEDYYNPANPNDYDDDVEKKFEQAKRADKGYNAFYRRVQRKDGTWRRKTIDAYSSGGAGTRIRDAETGEYSSNLVGSKNEDLYFKINIATGECTSRNGSSIFFYSSPQHYASHMNCQVDAETISQWEKKRDTRLAELKEEEETRARNRAVEVK